MLDAASVKRVSADGQVVFGEADGAQGGLAPENARADQVNAVADVQVGGGADVPCYFGQLPYTPIVDADRAQAVIIAGDLGVCVEEYFGLFGGVRIHRFADRLQRVVDVGGVERVGVLQLGAAVKGVLRRFAQPGIHLNRLKAGAVGKGLAADGHGGLGDHNLCQLGAVGKGARTDVRQSIGQLHGAQIGQAAEGVISDGGDTVRQDDPVDHGGERPAAGGHLQRACAGEGQDARAAERPGDPAVQRSTVKQVGGKADGKAVPGAGGAVIQLGGDPGAGVGGGVDGELAAGLEGIVADSGRRAAEMGGGQTGAAEEGIAVDQCHTGRDGDGGQSAAVGEGVAADLGEAVRNGDRGQGGAVSEGVGGDLRHTGGDIDGGQRFALGESLRPNLCHTVGECDGGKLLAIVEGIAADPRHSVGDGDGGNDLLIKGVAADGGHAAFKHYLFDAARNTAPRGAGGVIVIHSAGAADGQRFVIIRPLQVIAAPAAGSGIGRHGIAAIGLGSGVVIAAACPGGVPGGDTQRKSAGGAGKDTVSPVFGRVPGKGGGGKTAASGKGVISNGGEAAKELHIGKARTAGEGGGADGGDAVGNVHILKLCTAGEGGGANGGNAIRNRNAGKARAVGENRLAKSCDHAGDSRGGETRAAIEGVVAERGKTGRQGQRSKAAAIAESGIANGGRTIIEIHRGKLAAIGKGIVADSGGAVDRHRGERAAGKGIGGDALCPIGYVVSTCFCLREQKQLSTILAEKHIVNCA